MGAAGGLLGRPAFRAAGRAPGGQRAPVRLALGLRLAKLSAWWLQLGIRVEFIASAHPKQHGAHERMHRTLKAETTWSPAATPRAQQARLDRWRHTFNSERPHEALGMQRPAQQYRPSAWRHTAHPMPIANPGHYEVRRVKRQGVIKWRNRFCDISEPSRAWSWASARVTTRMSRREMGIILADILRRIQQNQVPAFTHRSDLQDTILALLEEFTPELLALRVRRS